MARLIDADAFLEEARKRIDMQDLYLPIHIKDFVIDEMPTVEAIPVNHILACIREYATEEPYDMHAVGVLAWLIAYWKEQNERA